MNSYTVTVRERVITAGECPLSHKQNDVVVSWRPSSEFPGNV